MIASTHITFAEFIYLLILTTTGVVLNATNAIVIAFVAVYRISISRKYYRQNMSIHFKTLGTAVLSSDADSFGDDDCHYRYCRNSYLYPKKRHIHLYHYRICFTSTTGYSNSEWSKTLLSILKSEMCFSDGNESSAFLSYANRK